MSDIFGLTCQELQAALQPFSLPKYRAKQIAEWMYQRGATSFGDMTNLSKKLREELASSLAIGRPRLKDRLDSADGHTTKFLLEFADGTVSTAIASASRRRLAATWAVLSAHRRCTAWRAT